MSDELCETCGIGYYLPSGVCDHCNVRQAHSSAPTGSTPTSLFVSARVYNEPGIYRVLEIGIEDGHKNNSHDVARLLRKLADWVEKEKA